MIIDGHVHVTEDGKWFDTHHDASLARLIREMDNCDIEKAVLLPIAPFTSNKFIASVCQQYPDRFIGFGSVNPIAEGAVETLRNEFSELGLKGIKLHPRLQKFSLADERAIDVIRKAAERNIPLVIDAWIGKDMKGIELIDDIELVAGQVPEAKIIFTHLGGFAHDRVPEMAKNHSNIYFDLSFVLTYFDRDYLEMNIIQIMKEIDSSRMMYGSDFPEVKANESYSATKLLIDEHFSPKDSRQIFGESILKLINGE